MLKKMFAQWIRNLDPKSVGRNKRRVPESEFFFFNEFMTCSHSAEKDREKIKLGPVFFLCTTRKGKRRDVFYNQPTFLDMCHSEMKDK